MARRLQTVLFKKGMARSVKQARQFIVHEHVLIGDKKITSPAYLVKVSEEASISFAVSSPLISEDHPERASVEKLAEMQAEKDLLAKQAAEEKARIAEREAREKAEGIEEVAPDEEDIKKAEAEALKAVEEPAPKVAQVPKVAQAKEEPSKEAKE